MDVQELTSNVSDSVERISTIILLYLPNILGAVALLLLGGLLAYLLAWMTRSLIEKGLRRLARTKTIRARIQQSDAFQSLPQLLGRLVFWVILLFFLAASVEALGLPAVSRIIGHAMAYLPHVLAAVVILFAGFWLGELARGLTRHTSASLNVARSDLLGQAARVIVIALSMIVAIDQLGIDSTVLVTVMITILAATFGAASLAFGLGARQAVSNIIGLHYFRQTYGIGDRIRINDIEGTVLEVSNTTVTLDTQQGRMLIPGHQFSDQPSVLLSRAE